MNNTQQVNVIIINMNNTAAGITHNKPIIIINMNNTQLVNVIIINMNNTQQANVLL